MNTTRVYSRLAINLPSRIRMVKSKRIVLFWLFSFINTSSSSSLIICPIQISAQFNEPGAPRVRTHSPGLFPFESMSFDPCRIFLPDAQIRIPIGRVFRWYGPWSLLIDSSRGRSQRRNPDASKAWALPFAVDTRRSSTRCYSTNIARSSFDRCFNFLLMICITKQTERSEYPILTVARDLHSANLVALGTVVDRLAITIGNPCPVA